jgi:hypothetical protein
MLSLRDDFASPEWYRVELSWVFATWVGYLVTSVSYKTAILGFK